MKIKLKTKLIITDNGKIYRKILHIEVLDKAKLPDLYKRGHFPIFIVSNIKPPILKCFNINKNITHLHSILKVNDMISEKEYENLLTHIENSAKHLKRVNKELKRLKTKYEKIETKII